MVSIHPTTYPTIRSIYLDGRCVATVGDTRHGGYDALLWDFPQPVRDLGRFSTLSEALGAILRAVAAC